MSDAVWATMGSIADLADLGRQVKAEKARAAEEWPRGAVAVTRNLDLLADQDEPMSLVDELHLVAMQKAVGSPRAAEWELVAEYLAKAQVHLRARNEPASKDMLKDEGDDPSAA